MSRRSRILRITSGNFDQLNQVVVTNKDGSVTAKSKTDEPTTITPPVVVPENNIQNKDSTNE